MKYIIYILIAVFLSSVFFAAIPASVYTTQKVVTLQCSNPKASELEASALILDKRLKTFGVEAYKIMLSDSAIHIRFEKGIDDEILENLLLTQADFGFYETCTNQTILDLLKSDSALNSHVTFSSTDNGIWGTSSTTQKADVNKLLTGTLENKLSSMHVKLLWSKTPSSDEQWELYILNKTSVLGGEFVSSAEVTDDNSLNIKLDEKGAVSWRTITREHMNEPIALVMDDEVYFAPTVRSEITNGNCMISGDFSKDELKLLSVLITCGRLPLEFEIK